jgi:glycosyltransferase involved in cell wall biosynthesis
MLTYNRERIVGRMIECILKQQFTEFEFIVIDNGSIDASGKVAESYAATDNRIKVIRREKGNIGSGRNAGLDFATGEYIAFVDDDDFCEGDYLQFLYDLAIENGSDASICGADWANVDEKRIMSPEDAVETMLWRKRYNVAFPTKLFKRDLFENNRFLETGKYDDIYLMPKILASATKVAYHGISKYNFNRHESNNSAWTQNHKLLDAETLQEYLDVYDERTTWLSKRFPNGADKWRYFNWSFMLSMVEKITRLELADCYKIKEKLLKELTLNKNEFTNGGYAIDFEREWIERYVTQKNNT